MATVVKVKTPEGVRKYKLEDFRPYFLFDTITLTSGTAHTEAYYFVTPEGKTPVDTNMTQYSTIPIGWIMDVMKIRLIPITTVSAANAKAIFANSVIAYTKEGDMIIFSLPAIMLNAGCGLSGTTTVTDTDLISLGLPSQSAVLKLPFPLTITGGKTFSMRQQWSPAVTPTTTVKIRMVLEGVLRKEVVGA